MARSLKKGPYIDPKLMKKVEKLNESNQKKVVKTSPLPTGPLQMPRN